MDKNEAILKSYRFLSPSIMTTGRKGRKIGIAVKAKAEGKKKKEKKKNLVLQDKNVWGATKNAKTFQMVLKTLNLPDNIYPLG